MSKDGLTTWTVDEIIDNVENLNAKEVFYEQEEVNSLFSDVYDELDDALREIQDIQGIDSIDECKTILEKVIKMIY